MSCYDLMASYFSLYLSFSVTLLQLDFYSDNEVSKSLMILVAFLMVYFISSTIFLFF